MAPSRVFLLLVAIIVSVLIFSFVCDKQAISSFSYGASLGKKEATVVDRTRSDTEVVTLLGREIGAVSRICATKDKECLITPNNNNNNNTHTKHDNDCPNMNGPMPIRPRPWMHKELQQFPVILYYSSHNDNVKGFVQLMGGGEGQPWKMIIPNKNLELSFPETRCESLHSPSIFVEDDSRRLYMYIHGHSCGVNGQPTMLLISEDGISWKMENNDPPHQQKLLLEQLFYLTVPVPIGDYYYALAKTQENSVGSAMLLRARALTGPFEEGPILARGLRHMDIIHVVGSTMYIVFTMIGDAPERILLGTIELPPAAETAGVNSSSHNWMDAVLLPGTTLISPQRNYEHGHDNINSTDHTDGSKQANNTIQPSTSGQAGCAPLYELRDPKFLPDLPQQNNNNSNNHHIISGLLFYTVQGEHAFALARIYINTLSYAHSVRYRNHTNIDPRVRNATSLTREEDDTLTIKKMESVRPVQTLITGTGRSGTTYLCTFYTALGFKISHDNDVDCGPYPGEDGAVSWYDSFDGGRRYNHVLHVVRHPLDVIQSRAYKEIALPSHFKWFRSQTARFEDTEAINRSFRERRLGNETEYRRNVYVFSLQHWVRRNSFLDQHASWRERIEELSMDPLADWRMCLAGNFGRRCPDLVTFRQELAIHQSKNQLNSMYAGSNMSQQQILEGISGNDLQKKKRLTWAELEHLVREAYAPYVWIARRMGLFYGYPDHEGGSGTLVDYDCGFDELLKWDCWVR